MPKKPALTRTHQTRKDEEEARFEAMQQVERLEPPKRKTIGQQILIWRTAGYAWTAILAMLADMLM